MRLLCQKDDIKMPEQDCKSQALYSGALVLRWDMTVGFLEVFLLRYSDILHVR